MFDSDEPVSAPRRAFLIGGAAAVGGVVLWSLKRPQVMSVAAAKEATVAQLRQNPASLAGWNVIAELEKKLPADLEAAEPISLDTAAVSIALKEAEGLLLARLSALESL